MTTAGPFLKVGRPVVVAAVEAGAIYLDSSGEPPFIRQMFEEFGPRAERTGAVLVTACGYDDVPGNLAGALALEAAGPAATRVQVGYFVRGRIGKAGSAGSRASAAAVLLEDGYTFRGGRIVSERLAAHVTSFEIDGKPEEAFSTGSSEQFALPRLRLRATEQAALKCLYLVTRSLDPSGKGQVQWTMRWQPVLNAFAITFGDRFPAAETY